VTDTFRAFRAFEEDGRVQGRVVPMALDELSAGDVVIRAAYSSVNYKDALAATGVAKILSKLPLVGGIDVAGTVASSHDSRFSEGDKVIVTGYDLGVGNDGGYAAYVRVPADWIVKLPSSLTLFEAMALGTAGFTAALSVIRLEQNGLTPGAGPVVVTGATGGVGSIAVAILSGLGYDVTAVTGKDSEHEYLKSLGAKHVMRRPTVELNSKPLEIGEMVKAQTVAKAQRGVDHRVAKPAFFVFAQFIPGAVGRRRSLDADERVDVDER